MQVQLHKYYCGNCRQRNNKTKRTASGITTKSKMTAQRVHQNRRANNSRNKRITNTHTHIPSYFSCIFLTLLLAFIFSWFCFQFFCFVLQVLLIFVFVIALVCLPLQVFVMSTSAAGNNSP